MLHSLGGQAGAVVTPLTSTVIDCVLSFSQPDRRVSPGAPDVSFKLM